MISGFCQFFTCLTIVWILQMSNGKNPMWMVQSLIDELNYRAHKHWISGKYVAIDEQTIGFKGRSGMKLRISYKRKGDHGFQCNALFNERYTFSFFFQNGDPPKKGREYNNLGLSAL